MAEVKAYVELERDNKLLSLEAQELRQLSSELTEEVTELKNMLKNAKKDGISSKLDKLALILRSGFLQNGIEFGALERV